MVKYIVMGLRGLERRFDRFRRTGDSTALAAVFDATAAEILKVAAHLSREAGGAEDLLQRTFLTAIEAAPTWDRSRRLLPWLLGILSNHAKEASRRAARSPDAARLARPEAESPLAAASRHEEERAAGFAIDALPDPVRSILILRFRHGLEPAEIALALGLPPATVRSHLHRGIERVRTRVPNALASLSGFGVAVRPLAEIRSVVVARATAVGARIAATAAASAAVGAATGASGFVLGGIVIGTPMVALAAGVALLLGVASYVFLARDGGSEAAREDAHATAPGLERPETTLASRPGAASVKPAITSAQPGGAGATHPAGEFGGIGGRAVAEGTRMPPGAARIRGKVIDDAGTPVAGATVEVRLSAALEGRALSVLETQANGEFEGDVDVPQGKGVLNLTGLVIVREGVRVAMRSVPVSYPTWPANISTIVLEPAQAFDVQVTSSCRAGLPAWVQVFRRPGVPGSPWARVRTDAHAHARVEGLPPGDYQVVATADGCARAAVDLVLPREESSPVLLALGEERVVDVLVFVEGSEEPIPGATLDVWQNTGGALANLEGLPATPPTDERGHTRVHGLGSKERLVLAAHASGFSGGLGMGDRALVDPEQTEARIHLTRNQAVTWPLVDGEAPVPADGTVVKLLPLPPRTGWPADPVPPEGRVVGRALVVEGFAASTPGARAIAPDGSIAVLRRGPGESVGAETSFRAPRRIEVSLTYSDGAPIAGWLVIARPQVGPKAPASAWPASSLGSAVRTDARGRAVLEGLSGGEHEQVDVFAYPQPILPPGWTLLPGWKGSRIGTADLGTAVTTIDATLEREREILARVRVAGKPGLPPAYTLDLGSDLKIAPGPGFHDAHDAEKGILRFSWRPSGRAGGGVVKLLANGYHPASAPIPEGMGPAEVDFALEPAGSLVVRVTSPSDGIFGTMLQRWDPGKGQWVRAVLGEDAADAWRLKVTQGVARLEELPAGRYRVADVLSWTVSEAVEVTPSGIPAEARLDLTHAGYVKGRIVGPEGTRFDGSGVLVEGSEWSPSSELAHPSGWADEAGVFTARVPGTRPVTLVPTHYLLVPAAQGGSVTVTDPREGVELRMVLGNAATLRFDRVAQRESELCPNCRVRALLYRGEPTGPPAFEGSARLEGATARFGGFEPGTWTIWIDSLRFEPTVLRGVKLVAGENDLGTAVVAEGSSVRVKLLVKEGQPPPHYYVTVRREGEGPLYTRGTWTEDGSEVRVCGLGAGRYQVYGALESGGAASGAPLEKVVDLDGKTDVSFTVDLR